MSAREQARAKLGPDALTCEEECDALADMWRSAAADADEANEAVTKLADEWAELGLKLDRAEAVVEAARSLHAGLTCPQDPMDVDERIERLGAALADAS